MLSKCCSVSNVLTLYRKDTQFQELRKNKQTKKHPTSVASEPHLSKCTCFSGDGLWSIVMASTETEELEAGCLRGFGCISVSPLPPGQSLGFSRPQLSFSYRTSGQSRPASYVEYSAVLSSTNGISSVLTCPFSFTESKLCPSVFNRENYPLLSQLFCRSGVELIG